MEDTIINLASQPTTLIPLIGGAAYTSLCTFCSVLSRYLPDTINKESKVLGIRVGRSRGIYNRIMKFVNKVAFNTGKATNNPEVQ